MSTKKPYLIMVASQKGGVGKTTVAVNLAIALRKQNYAVMLVDADISTFSVNAHVGVRPGARGFAEAVNGDSSINESLFSYQPLDLHLLLGSDAKEVPKFDAEDLAKFYSQLAKTDYDFIVVDNAPGLFDSSYARYINDVIIVTTPDAPSAVSNAKLAAYCEKLRLSHRLLINKSGYTRFELERQDVERLFGDVAYGMLPEDRLVTESLSRRVPAYLLDSTAPFPTAIEALSRVYTLHVSEAITSKYVGRGMDDRGIFRRIATWTMGSK